MKKREEKAAMEGGQETVVQYPPNRREEAKDVEKYDEKTGVRYVRHCSENYSEYEVPLTTSFIHYDGNWGDIAITVNLEQGKMIVMIGDLFTLQSDETEQCLSPVAKQKIRSKLEEDHPVFCS